jgi:hypothetical protein
MNPRLWPSSTILVGVLSLWTLLFVAFALVLHVDGWRFTSLAGTWALFAVPFTALFVWRMRSQ